MGFVLDVFLGLIAPPEVGVGGTAPWPDPLTSCCAGSPAGLGGPNFRFDNKLQKMEDALWDQWVGREHRAD